MLFPDIAGYTASTGPLDTCIPAPAEALCRDGVADDCGGAPVGVCVGATVVCGGEVRYWWSDYWRSRRHNRRRRRWRKFDYWQLLGLHGGGSAEAVLVTQMTAMTIMAAVIAPKVIILIRSTSLDCCRFSATFQGRESGACDHNPACVGLVEAGAWCCPRFPGIPVAPDARIFR